jgi:hypothetical protein
VLSVAVRLCSLVLDASQASLCTNLNPHVMVMKSAEDRV